MFKVLFCQSEKEQRSSDLAKVRVRLQSVRKNLSKMLRARRHIPSMNETFSPIHRSLKTNLLPLVCRFH